MGMVSSYLVTVMSQSLLLTPARWPLGPASRVAGGEEVRSQPCPRPGKRQELDLPAPPWWQSRGHPLGLIGQHVGFRRYGCWLAEGRAVEQE